VQCQIKISYTFIKSFSYLRHILSQLTSDSKKVKGYSKYFYKLDTKTRWSSGQRFLFVTDCSSWLEIINSNWLDILHENSVCNKILLPHHHSQGLRLGFYQNLLKLLPFYRFRLWTLLDANPRCQKYRPKHLLQFSFFPQLWILLVLRIL
jgi:hypothetical protein